ncbi:uncharacterized protein LOC124418771 [Lucilia cuprina]|uniref:uncharacterized protein LOC124418771 n=1 Tax=Lucilia cuprina TaxID=7375 RepID=UPI001F06CC1C|nr:uncharacterized protein LOC124418771 [Lucilia cuprina]
MAAVIYLRIITEFDSVSVHLIEAKTKVAPTKRQTIPRLELNAALILTKRVAHFKSILNLNHVSTHLWTDSSVALTWIKGHPSRWKDYVANRVLKIQDVLPHAKWHHIPGKCNPADCASRGIAVQQLIEHPLWWHGPLWLLNHSSSWPSADIKFGQYQFRGKIISSNCKHSASSSRRANLGPNQQIFKINSFDKDNCYLPSKIKALHAGQQLQNSHPLSKFTPFIDAYGLLRVGGRLRNALIDPNAKHPILLPSKSTFTNLLIAEAHEKTLHGGVQVMSVYLWQSYWILGGRSAIKAFNHRCVRCAKIRGVTARQLMGQLPSIRTIPARPFLHSGVDYAGPLSIKTWRGRGAKQYKGYIALFVCLSTSAVHLEVASDYSVDGFLAAFKRFVSRRGVCSTLTSDCGTNFIGADAELKRLFTQCSKEYSKLSTILANDGTQWKFNPPSAPHFGGKWEASVKSVKFHLRRIIGDTALTYEELTTLLAQIEAVLNSRPLCALSDDPSDVNAITPAHFLIGSALNAVPEPSVLDFSVSRLSRLQLIQQMIESFWKRWSNEYLQRFRSMSKWKQQENSIKKGSLVLIADERYPPMKWPLGRILEVHPGPDGLIRVVTVKTASSTLKRPLVKICPLPVDEERDLKKDSNI